ncbi:MAG: zinc-dependent metalloprotease [Ferruginibacter sp.]|nr:zinc-dependent metalloprotease [Ferruginibacter sp.]
MKYILTLFINMVLCVSVNGQKIIEVDPFEKVKEGVYSLIDTNDLYRVLEQCPDNLFDGKLPYSKVRITLPNGENSENYDLYKTHSLHPELAKKYKEIRTYYGQGVEDKSKVVYITFSPAINSILFINNEKSFKLSKDNHTQTYSIDKSVFYYTENFKCGNIISSMNRSTSSLLTDPLTSCRTFRITAAFSCTRRFSSTISAITGQPLTKGLIMSKLADIISTELNPVFGREAGITFQLSVDQENVIFVNNEPYTPNDISRAAEENAQIFVSNIIDPTCRMGIVLDKGDGSILGIAGISLARVCESRSEIGGNGVFYFGNGDNLPRAGDMIHEIGHFLGAKHTFNYINCGNGERTLASVEPYGGYSIMGYPDVTDCWGNQNLSGGFGFGFPRNFPNNEVGLEALHFNAISLKQMYAQIELGGCLNPDILGCPQNLNAIENTPNTFTIPKGNSFTLRGNKVGYNSTIFYQFNQVDNGFMDTYPPILNDPSIPLTPSFRARNNYVRFFRGPIEADSNQFISETGRIMNFNYLKREVIGGIGLYDIRHKPIIVDDNRGPLQINLIDGIYNEKNTIINDFKFSESHIISWDVNQTNLFEQAKVLDFYLINEDNFNGRARAFDFYIDSSSFLLIAKDVPNNGLYTGRVFFNNKITEGNYHLVLMAKDKSFFAFSHSKIEIKPQLIYPIGGEILLQGSSENKAFYIPSQFWNGITPAVRTILSLDIGDGNGYTILTSSDNALDSINLVTTIQHVSNTCKVKVEFTDGPGGPILETLESADYFSIIDRIPSMSFNLDDFSRLAGLNGKIVVPAINGIFKGCTLTSSLQDELQNFVEPTGYAGYPQCLPGAYFDVPRPKSYSRTFDNHLTNINNQLQINATYLNQRITSPFLLNYTITTTTTLSNDVTYEFCNIGVDGPCPRYGIYFGGTCFPGQGCYELDTMSLHKDYYCKPGIFQITTSITNYREFHQNYTPSQSTVYAQFDDIIPSKHPILISPNGYELLEAGGFMLVSWFNPFFQPDNYSAVDIYTSSDNGITYSLVVSGVPSSNVINTYKIKLPSTNLTSGSSCKVKVTMRGDLYRTPTPFIDLSDESDSAFTIIPDIAYNLGVVPLTLLSFTGETLDLHNELKWTTTNEINVEKFEVERSLNGQSFEKIGTVISRNIPGNHIYFHIDRNAPEMAFYRLKIIDLDGTHAYSEIVQLSRRLKLLFSMNPNPVVNQLNVSGLESGGRVELLTIDGKKLQSHPIISQSIQLQMSSYSKGTYIVRYLKPNGEIINSKVIKH